LDKSFFLLSTLIRVGGSDLGRLRKSIEHHREYHKNYQKQYHTNLKQKVLNHYGKICKICGETDIKKLCTDHIHEDGRNHREELSLKAEGFNTQFYSWLIKNNFPEGFQTLCITCNSRKSALYRWHGLDKPN
jgi:DNA mismatch repair ATPase MutS